MSSPIRLFQIGQRGVDVVSKPQDLDELELVSGQNVEVSTSGGGGALDQRPGMTRIGNTPLGGPVLMALDIPSQLLTDLTPYLYAGVYSTGLHNWRASSDGVTWTNVDTLVKPFSNNGNIALYTKNIPKAVTVGKKMYYADANSPIRIHAWDGTTDTIVGTVPSTVAGANLVPPDVGRGNGLTPYGFSAAPSASSQGPNLPGTTSYVYKLVATNGASHSLAVAVPGFIIDPITNGFANLDSTHYNWISVNVGSSDNGRFPGWGNVPPAGATSVDVYRTTGGATQGKIGSIPIINGQYTGNNGSGLASVDSSRPWLTLNFTDGGLVGDGSTPPVSAVGASAANALAVLDMITDGASIYVATLDNVGTDPNPVGRLLQFFPQTALWAQIGLAFPIAAGSGTPAALTLFDGAITFGDYIGTTAGNASYVTGVGVPLPSGGITEIHATAVSVVPTSIASFNGELFVGTTYLSATAAIILKRTTAAVWSTSLTAGAAGVQNGFTSLCVFGGRLYAAWASGAAATAAKIYSTPDGVNWTLEITTAVAQVPGQMVVFGGALYVALAGAHYTQVSKILQRTSAGVWTYVDGPTDALAGALAVVYQ